MHHDKAFEKRFVWFWLPTALQSRGSRHSFPLHVKHATMSGYKIICILTVDVVVMVLFHYFDLDIEKLWVVIGVSKNRRWLPIYVYAAVLGEEICRALPFWFALTGCDIVFMFGGRGKQRYMRVISRSYRIICKVILKWIGFFHIYNLWLLL